MRSLLLATTNSGKLTELTAGFSPLTKLGIITISLKDVNITTEPVETGATFAENAYLKAKFYSELSKLPTVADDGGLIIPYLNNAPGVRSRRWPGYEACDQELIDYTLKNLKNAKGIDRAAYLETYLCFYDPITKKSMLVTEKIKGVIADSPSTRRVDGYPYRSLFIVKDLNKYYDELTESEHHKINHRLKAVHKLSNKIKPFLIQ